MALKPQHPFYCLQYVDRQDSSLIIASAGAKIYSFSANDGRRLYTWPPSGDTSNTVPQGDSAERGDEPPEKKRKLLPGSTAGGEQGGAQEKSDSAINTPTWSTIPILVISHSGRYVIAVTAEDKHVRVLEIGSDGVLTQLSARSVPKRPCAISLSFDDNTIFSADKGGDVYGLSFHPSEDGEIRIASRPKKVYQPAANAQVVHTKRNLFSLQQQIRQQQERKNQGNESKVSLQMKPDALLGHISILTDMAIGAVPSGSSADKSHLYLLTADRDEQIRVSRGPPQTHIIEAYCLGHESFITRLCMLTSAPHLLISGGGDDYLLVWDWRIGQPLHKVQIAPEGQQGKATVRGIWEIRIKGSSSVAIIVAFDGSPELQSFLLQEDGQLTPQKSIQASGNVLDIAWAESQATLFLSIDACHEAGSTKTWRKDFNTSQPLFESYTAKVQDSRLEFDLTTTQVVDAVNSQGTEDVVTVLDDPAQQKAQKALTGTLYNLENLRKGTKGDDS
ncbi:tRNA (guanine-N(7)-)-methyltransferase subunit trm82 [Talaromyces islandicus]|uniref:tRNA (Guanine-N(7)-)-methyltransferase subunit trm82 n=1 Tax=Talaromyces islandicus TaxID=28573 RepID=A0A0U1M4C7_TALIS|nr:tRNA (guanine-N(7)-)-methyltransferase subunit trm82 [Talaromyces islandicus]